MPWAAGTITAVAMDGSGKPVRHDVHQMLLQMSSCSAHPSSNSHLLQSTSYCKCSPCAHPVLTLV